MKNTLIYFNAGDDCLYSKQRTPKEIKAIKTDDKNSGHIGYLSGFRYWDGKTETVLVFFKEKPTVWDIEKRRTNGFKSAKWYYL